MARREELTVRFNDQERAAVDERARLDGVSAAAVLRMLVHQHLMTAQATAKPRKVAKRAVKRGGK